MYIDTENDIAIVKWYVNKPIIMDSSAFGIEPEDTCSRWCNKDKDRKQVTRPAVIAAYNKSMGGVDMCNRMMAYHNISSRKRRWNLLVLLHFVDHVLSNSWLEWKKDGHSGLQLYDFRISVVTCLINAAEESGENDDIRRLPKKNAIVGLPTDPYRTSSASHLPVWEDGAGVKGAVLKHALCAQNVGVFCVRHMAVIGSRMFMSRQARILDV